MPRSHHNEKQTSTFITREWMLTSAEAAHIFTRWLSGATELSHRRSQTIHQRRFDSQRMAQMSFTARVSPFHPALKGLAAVLVLLRPSNEALLRARVPGAKNQHSCQSFRCPILLSVPLQRRMILSLCLTQISVLTSNEKMKNSCLCSFTIATTGKHPKAASAPPDE